MAIRIEDLGGAALLKGGDDEIDSIIAERSALLGSPSTGPTPDLHYERVGEARFQFYFDWLFGQSR